MTTTTATATRRSTRNSRSMMVVLLVPLLVCLVMITLLAASSCMLQLPVSHAFPVVQPIRRTGAALVATPPPPTPPTFLLASSRRDDGQQENEVSGKFASSLDLSSFQDNIQKAMKSVTLALTIVGISSLAQFPVPTQPAFASDPKAIVGCLFQKCAVPLGKCILNPKCLANVACINTCNGRDDEIDCQIQCGDLFENTVVGEFNKCAVSDMSCVPQQQDDGSYPVPAADKLVPKFDTRLFQGRWYITAGQNPLFDIFPCQVHFFESTGSTSFVGKLNWRIEEPDGETFTRDAVQAFKQDPEQPAHLLNHDNDYLHYQDDWYIIDYAGDNNREGVAPFAFVYYRGSNDAWDGYGGAVVYTRESSLPESLLPRLRTAAQKVGYDFDQDFTQTDNTCPTTELSKGEKLVLREQFAGKVALQTEKQLQAAAVRIRGNAASTIQTEEKVAQNVLQRLEQKTKEFENEIVKEARELEKEVVDLEKEVVKEAEDIVEEVEKDIVEEVTVIKDGALYKMK